jgi:hypothetical protein
MKVSLILDDHFGLRMEGEIENTTERVHDIFPHLKTYMELVADNNIERDVADAILHHLSGGNVIGFKELDRYSMKMTMMQIHGPYERIEDYFDQLGLDVLHIKGGKSIVLSSQP